MSKTTIEWAEEVWNPVTGCTKISAGCKNCYAERFSRRLWAEQYSPNNDGSPRKFTDLRFHPERLDKPAHWKKPRRVFVNSVSDLFHKDVSEEFIDSVWNVMFNCPEHTFIVLTKRADRMREILNKRERSSDPADRQLKNVWLGVSVEDQKAADERIPALLDTPAAVRFASVEPMIGPVELLENLGQYTNCPECGRSVKTDEDGLCISCGRDVIQYGLDWVICGCESGPGRRPMNLDWARSLRDECQGAGVPFFFKQAEIGGKLVKMPELDGRVWGEYPGGEE